MRGNSKQIWHAILPIFGIGVLCAVLVIGYVIFYGYQTSRDFIALLDGEERLGLQRFEIKGHTKSLVCENSECCRYIETMMRRSKKGNYVGGDVGFQGKFTLSNGWTSVVQNLDLADDGFLPSIPEARPVEPGIPTHFVIFEKPLPPAIEAAWKILKGPEGLTGKQRITGDPHRGKRMVIDESGELRIEPK